MKSIKIIGLAGLLALALTTTVFAAEFIAPQKNGSGNIDLDSSETHNNLHVAGGIVTVNSKTTGDLLAAGGIIKITGDVQSDLFLAGGRLDVDAAVGKNAHIAGGNIYVNKPIGGDLIVGGGVVEITKTAPISGDLVVGGGDVIINSTVTGNVKVSAGKSLVFGSNANITGKIVYYGNADPVIKEGAKVSAIEKHLLPKQNWFKPQLIGMGIILSLLAWIIAGLLVMHFLRPQLTEATGLLHASFWKSLGIGSLGLIVAPIIVILLFITLLGYYVGLVLIVWLTLVCLMSSLLGAVFLGRWLYGLLDKNESKINWQMVVLGVIVYKLITWVPVIGWIACGILFAASFGTVLRMAGKRLKANKA